MAAREQVLETIDILTRTHPQMASVLVTHHTEELPTTTSHALLIANGKTVAAGPAADIVNSENITFTFGHPIEVEYRHGRWSARVDRTLPPAPYGESEIAEVPA